MSKTRFKIVKGKPFQCTFIIKQPGSTIPIELDLATKGTFTVSTFGISPEVIHENIPLSLGSETDNKNGKMFLRLDESQTAVLETDVAFGEDGFPMHPTYKGILEVETSSVGTIFATVPKIFIEDIGL